MFLDRRKKEFGQRSWGQIILVVRRMGSVVDGTHAVTCLRQRFRTRDPGEGSEARCSIYRARAR